MDIPKHLIDTYLEYITVGYFDPEDLPPDDVSGYAHCVTNVKLHAQHFGDLEALKVAFDYLLAHPEIDSEQFAGGRYPYFDEEVREILRYAVATIWPGAAPTAPEVLAEVRIVGELSLDEWRRQRRGQG